MRFYVYIFNLSKVGWEYRAILIVNDNIFFFVDLILIFSFHSNTEYIYNLVQDCTNSGVLEMEYCSLALSHW